MWAGATAPRFILVMSQAHSPSPSRGNLFHSICCVSLLVSLLQETPSAPYFVCTTGSQGYCSYSAPLSLFFLSFLEAKVPREGIWAPLPLLPRCFSGWEAPSKMWTPAALLEIRVASALADVGDINHSLQPQTLLWPKLREQWLVISKCVSWKAQADLHMEQNSCFYTHHTRLQPSKERTPGTIILHVLSTTKGEF